MHVGEHVTFRNGQLHACVRAYLFSQWSVVSHRNFREPRTYTWVASRLVSQSCGRPLAAVTDAEKVAAAVTRKGDGMWAKFV